MVRCGGTKGPITALAVLPCCGPVRPRGAPLAYPPPRLARRVRLTGLVRDGRRREGRRSLPRPTASRPRTALAIGATTCKAVGLPAMRAELDTALCGTLVPRP